MPRALPWFVAPQKDGGRGAFIEAQAERARFGRMILEERIRAHEKHDGLSGHSTERRLFDDARWFPILIEELGEVGRAFIDGPDREAVKHNARKELVQLMSMCAAWIDAIDMDGEKDDVPQTTHKVR